jgi:hypothetical protein
MTLQHPNILQFLRANTLDARPFVIMPLVPHNARDFLLNRVDFDPLYVVSDTADGTTMI